MPSPAELPLSNATLPSAPSRPSPSTRSFGAPAADDGDRVVVAQPNPEAERPALRGRRADTLEPPAHPSPMPLKSYAMLILWGQSRVCLRLCSAAPPRSTSSHQHHVQLTTSDF